MKRICVALAVLAVVVVAVPEAKAQGTVTKITVSAGTNAGDLNVSVIITPDVGYSVTTTSITAWQAGGAGTPIVGTLMQMGMTTIWNGTVSKLPSGVTCWTFAAVTFQNNTTLALTVINSDVGKGTSK